MEDQIKVYAADEIELAEVILDMERDVGKLCMNVEVVQTRTEARSKKSRKGVLKQIQHWAKILEKDC